MAELKKKRDSSPDNFQTEIVRVKKPKTAVVVDWQTRPVQTEEVERREEMVVTNPVILALIFSRLPPADLKTAALVCRTWSSVLELPRFWAWASVRLGRGNFSERRRSPRLRHVGGVLTELDLTTRERDIHHSHWSNSFIAVLSLVESSRLLKYYAFKGSIKDVL